MKGVRDLHCVIGVAFGCWLRCGCLASPESHLRRPASCWVGKFRDDSAFGGGGVVRCAEKCPTGDVNRQGKMWAVL